MIQVRKTAVTIVASLGLAVLSGCVLFESEKLPQPVAVVTCADVLRNGVSNFSDAEVVTVLQTESESKNIESCWMPVMQSALKETIVLPQSLLQQGVKRFNSEQYNDVFHTAVYRYLAGIARGQGSYRAEDKALLRAYCSYLINHAENRNDDRLNQIQLLTKRLDPEMYDRFFE